MKKIYLDYAASTPVAPAVLRAMMPYFSEEFGNPSNIYALGLKAKKAVAEAVRKITSVLNCAPDEFIFTGSATEADNLAILGAARANRKAGNKIIISNIEHKAVLSACKALKKEGFEIVELPVQKNGLVNPEELGNILDEKTILVSVMYANNEIGTIQPIREISKIINATRKTRISSELSEKKHSGHSDVFVDWGRYPLFHTDAAQALQFLDCDVNKLGVDPHTKRAPAPSAQDEISARYGVGVDLMTISSHKLYGPKGIGGLYVRRGVAIEPIIYGGGQQRNLRSGTENVPAIVGFGEAVVLAQKSRKTESARVKKLRDKLEKGIFKSIPKVVLNGHPTQRLPNFLNISILDIEGEALLLYLDEKGIFVNTGSACNSESLEPSHVLTALGNPYEYIHGSIRFTLGRGTTAGDIDYVLHELPPIVAKLRKISPLNLKLGKKEKISLPKAFIGGQTPHFLRKNEKKR
jgi:cysteine desulfurase